MYKKALHIIRQYISGLMPVAISEDHTSFCFDLSRLEVMIYIQQVNEAIYQ